MNSPSIPARPRSRVRSTSGGARVSAENRKLVRDLVKEVGVNRTAEELGVSRAVITRVCADLEVRKGSAVLLDLALRSRNVPAKATG